MSARLKQRFRALHQRPARIDQIVDHNAVMAANIADDVHDLGYIRLFPAFINNCQRSVQPLGKRPARSTPPASGETTVRLAAAETRQC